MTPEQIQNIRDNAHVGFFHRDEVLKLITELAAAEMKIGLLEHELMLMRCGPRLEDTYGGDNPYTCRSLYQRTNR